jgi:hypothetical protein
LTGTNYPAGTYPTFNAGPPPEPPDAEVFWPITGGTLDQNTDRIDRNAEIRGRRAGTPPYAFRARPVMTVPVPAYQPALATALHKVLGGTDTVTSSSSTYTHSFSAIGYGTTSLPTVIAQLVRDDLNAKMSGGTFERVTATFPLDGEGTAECEIHGLYYGNFSSTPPTPDFTGTGMAESDNVMMLRDAQMFVDDAVDAVDDLQGFTFAFVNNTVPKWYARRNIDTRVVGTNQNRRIWYPQINRIGPAQDVTFGFSLGSVDAAEELARDFGQIEKFVVEIFGDPIGVTSVNEVIRFTLFGGQLTGGGAGPNSARDDITSDFEGGVYFSSADSNDLLIEIVNGSSTPL